MAELITLLTIFLVGIFASSFGTLIGGTSLLTIPTLIFLGLPAAVAIGTNRAGLLGLAIAGWYEFDKKHFINYKVGWAVGIAAIFGAIIGANLVFRLDEVILEKVIAAITLLALIVVIIEHKAGTESSKKLLTRKEYAIGSVIGFLLGIYGGFYGANVGVFFSYLLILLFGQSFIESAATRKIAAFLMATGAFIVFAFNDAVIYSVALALFAGSFIGSYIGAAYSNHIGNVWIKRAFVVTVALMSLNLLFF